VPAREVFGAVFTEVDGDAIDPGGELRVAPELIDRLEDLDEDLLRHVLGLVAPAEHAEDEHEHAPLVGGRRAR
jgi:hypothetical protein